MSSELSKEKESELVVRQILAEDAGLDVNDTMSNLTRSFIFSNKHKPQSEFAYSLGPWRRQRMDYYTVKQAAESLGVNKETIRRWIRAGKIKAMSETKRLGYRIPEEELTPYLYLSKVLPKDEPYEEMAAEGIKEMTTDTINSKIRDRVAFPIDISVDDTDVWTSEEKLYVTATIRLTVDRATLREEVLISHFKEGDK